MADEETSLGSKIEGWVEDIIRLYAARAMGGLCNNSAQICETGKTGNRNQDTRERQKGRALAINVLTKGMEGVGGWMWRFNAC